MHTLRSYILLLLVLLLAACSEDAALLEPVEIDVPVGEPAVCKVSMDITLPSFQDVARGTRATPTDGTYNDGRSVAFENHIDIDGGNFRFMAFTLDDKYVATLKVDSLRIAENTANAKLYQVMGEFEVNPGTDFKLVMLANWPDYAFESTLVPMETTLQSIVESSCFMAPQPYVLSATHAIPMFGVKELRNKHFHESIREWLGTLHLLRALAKVEVRVAADAVNENGTPISLTKVRLVNYREKGLCIPRLTEYKESSYVTGSYLTDYTPEPSLPTGEYAETGVTGRTKEYTAAYNVVTFYMPECAVLEDRANLVPYGRDECVHMEVAFSDDADHWYDLEFKYYDESCAHAVGLEQYDYFDVKRNTYYIYNIVGREGNELSLLTDVVPYRRVELEPTFGLPLDESFVDTMTYCCGCQEDIALTKCFGTSAGIGLVVPHSTNDISAAVQFPADSTASYAGHKFKGIRIYIASTNTTKFEVWVKHNYDDETKLLCKDLSHEKLTRGWNVIEFDETFEIPVGGSPYAVGFTYRQPEGETSYAIGYNNTLISAGSMWVDKGTGVYEDCSPMGVLSMEGVIAGKCLCNNEPGCTCCEEGH